MASRVEGDRDSVLASVGEPVSVAGDCRTFSIGLCSPRRSPTRWRRRRRAHSARRRRPHRVRRRSKRSVPAAACPHSARRTAAPDPSGHPALRAALAADQPPPTPTPDNLPLRPVLPPRRPLAPPPADVAPPRGSRGSLICASISSSDETPARACENGTDDLVRGQVAGKRR